MNEKPLCPLDMTLVEVYSMGDTPFSAEVVRQLLAELKSVMAERDTLKMVAQDVEDARLDRKRGVVDAILYGGE